MSICRGCGAEIIWVTTADGKKMPLDPKPFPVIPAEGGLLRVVLGDGRVVAVRLAVSELDEGVVMGRTSHFATCPKAGAFRRGPA